MEHQAGEAICGAMLAAIQCESLPRPAGVAAVLLDLKPTAPSFQEDSAGFQKEFQRMILDEVRNFRPETAGPHVVRDLSRYPLMAKYVGDVMFHSERSMQPRDNRSWVDCLPYGVAL